MSWKYEWYLGGAKDDELSLVAPAVVAPTGQDCGRGWTRVHPWTTCLTQTAQLHKRSYPSRTWGRSISQQGYGSSSDCWSTWYPRRSIAICALAATTLYQAVPGLWAMVWETSYMPLQKELPAQLAHTMREVSLLMENLTGLQWDWIKVGRCIAFMKQKF